MSCISVVNSPLRHAMQCLRERINQAPRIRTHFDSLGDDDDAADCASDLASPSSCGRRQFHKTGASSVLRRFRGAVHVKASSNF